MREPMQILIEDGTQVIRLEIVIRRPLAQASQIGPVGPDDPILLTVKQAAKALNTGLSQVYELIQQRKIPFVPWGERSYRIPRAALETWAMEAAASQQGVGQG